MAVTSSLATTWAEHELRALDADGLRRFIEPLGSPQGAHVRLEGEGERWFVNFSSNDYLGLANDPNLREAMRAAAERHGVGSGASRLVVGDSSEHQLLERALAEFERTEAAVLFNSGYAANVGTLAALCGPGDVIFSDEMNHASIIDGCRLSRAHVVVYRHADVAHLERLLHGHEGRRRVVVTDTVFSMDGDRAPLRELSALCQRAAAALVVDEAHATGVLGERGAGLCEHLGVTPDVLVGTLSKAVGALGGYVASSRAVCDLLLNRSRSLVFSTALPPAVSAAARAGLAQLAAPERRAALWRNVEYLAHALGVEATSSIFSVPLGAPERALAAAEALRAQGLLVKAIRPPTVPVGTSRLRVAVSAAHSTHDLDRLIGALRTLHA